MSVKNFTSQTRKEQNKKYLRAIFSRKDSPQSIMKLLYLKAFMP